MKKISLLLLTLVLLLFAGCAGGDTGSTGEKNVEGTLSELLAKVTEGTNPEEIALMENAVTQDNFSMYFSTDYVEGSEALSSDAAISAIPHSITLLRLPEGTDYAQVEKDITDHLNPRKWVCVEADSAKVARRGDLILVAMSTKEAVDKAVANFNGL